MSAAAGLQLTTRPPRARPARATAVSLALHVAAPLALGFALYALRTPLIRLAASGPAGAAPLARFAAFNLADGLWAYSLTGLLAHLFPDPGAARTAWLGAALALAFGHELAQAAGLARGTFDPLDLLCFVAAWAAAIILTPRSARRTA